MKSESDEVFSLDVVSVRLVKDSPIFSERPINNPGDLVELLGEYMCELDREVICVVNLRNDGIPINCHFASVGAVNHALHPFEPKAMDIAACKERLKGHCAVIGNVDVDLLSRGTPEEVSKEVIRLLQTAAPGGGYALSSSNSVTDYVPVENYLAM